jgi:Streptomycin adenylyltransferase
MTEKERSALVEYLHHVANTDPRVVASFIGGSLATGTFDRYSDIDIYFVVDPSAYESFHSEVSSLLNSFGTLVYLDQHRDFGFDLVLFMFKNGVKGEIGLGTTQNLKDMHRGPFKILVDKTGVLKDVEFPLPPPLTGKDLREYVEHQLRWYWFWYGRLLSSCARDHLWSAELSLSSMRGRAFSLLKLVYQSNHHPEGVRFEASIPTSLQKELGATLPVFTSDSFRTSGELLTKIVKREIQPLLSSTNAEYPTGYEMAIMSNFAGE